MFIYMSKDDCIINNCQTNAFAREFNGTVTRATSSEGGHFVPPSGAQGFEAIFTFLNANHTDGSYTPPAPTPDETKLSGCEGFIACMARQFWWVILIACLCCCCCCGCCFYCVRVYCGGSAEDPSVSPFSGAQHGQLATELSPENTTDLKAQGDAPYGGVTTELQEAPSSSTSV